MGLTTYVGTCKGCIEQSGHPSEAWDSHPMLEHAKVVLSNQDIPSKIFEAWDSHAMWEHAKVVLSNQDIPSEILEAWDSQAMLKHAKIV